MIKTAFTLGLLTVSLIAFGQKDKIENVFFNADNDILVAFKSGTVALYSNPDLELLKEASPGDKKNKYGGAKISPSGKYLLVYDSKINQVIYYDAVTLEEKNRQDNKGLPSLAGENSVYSDGKIYSIPELEVLIDISAHDRPEQGITFSPSGKYYLNYETGGTGGDGDFAVFETGTGKMMGKSQLGDNNSEYVFGGKSYFTEDDSIVLIYRKFVEQDYYALKVPVYMDDDFEVPASQLGVSFEGTGNPEVDYTNLLITSGDFAADVSDDYTFYGMSAVQKATDDNEYLVACSTKNKIRLYQNDPATSEKQGDFKKSTLLKELEIPSE